VQDSLENDRCIALRHHAIKPSRYGIDSSKGHPCVSDEYGVSRPPLLLQAPARLESINLRHIDVEHDHAGLELGSDVDRGLTAKDHPHLGTQYLQELADDFGSIMVVVHDQTSHWGAIIHDPRLTFVAHPFGKASAYISIVFSLHGDAARVA
jgi:hypothetical protein